MDFKEELLSAISTQGISTYPFDHLQVDDLFGADNVNQLLKSALRIEDSSPTKSFDTEFGQKKEYRSFDESSGAVLPFIEALYSDQFLRLLKDKFQIPADLELFPDWAFDGGGYVVSPQQAFLSYHADFNFSSQVGMYRVLNVLFYMNDSYVENQGGELHLLDSVSKTVEKRVLPKLNTLIAFKTDDISLHGVSRNSGSFNRRSFNIYYYAKSPVSINQSSVPHKTLWVEFGGHDH